ncbi:MAG: AzlD domain-containing protein [Anaerolineales bacterium]
METMATTWLILALALGTFAWRFVPFAVLTRIELPDWAREWLRLVPGAILAASLTQTLLVQGNRINLSWANIELLAALPAFLVAWRTRSMILTMLSGMLSYALLQHVFF